MFRDCYSAFSCSLFRDCYSAFSCSLFRNCYSAFFLLIVPRRARPTRGEEGAAPKTPLTLKVTLLDPVVMLPQDDRDPDSQALFLRGLVMANYVRYDKNYTVVASFGKLAGGAPAPFLGLQHRAAHPLV